MKRQQQKLAVRRDTIKQLAAAALAPVRGGESGGVCTAIVPPPAAAPKP